MGIPVLKARRSRDRLAFNMGIPIQVKPLYTKTTPRAWISMNRSHVSFLCSAYWGRMTHLCISKLSLHCFKWWLSPDRRQTVIWTNVDLLLIEHVGTNFREVWIRIQHFLLKKINLKVSSARWRPFLYRPRRVSSDLPGDDGEVRERVTAKYWNDVINLWRHSRAGRGGKIPMMRCCPFGKTNI